MLVVDDDEAARRAAAQGLPEAGLEVVEAGDGERVLERLRGASGVPVIGRPTWPARGLLPHHPRRLRRRRMASPASPAVPITANTIEPGSGTAVVATEKFERLR